MQLENSSIYWPPRRHPRNISILIESVLGERAYVVPPAPHEGSACAATNMESCSSSTRCSPASQNGKWFALEHFGVIPISYLEGHCLGLPLSGVFSRLELMRSGMWDLMADIRWQT